MVGPALWLSLLLAAAAPAASSGAEATSVEGVLELFGLPGDPELLRGELRARLRGVPVVPPWVEPALESMQCHSCDSEACPSGLSLKTGPMLPVAQACEAPDQTQCCDTATSSTASTTSATSSTSTISTTTCTTSTRSTTTSTTATTTGTTTSTSSTTTTSSTPFGGPFDCAVDYEDLATAWSGWKLQWCCENEGMGCPTLTSTATVLTETFSSLTTTSLTTASSTTASSTTVSSATASSSTTVSSSMTTTSATTSTESTSSFTVESGCQSAMDLESACTLWSLTELEWCCRNRGYGCPLYDCDAGLDTAEFGWSSPKMSWCCTCMDKGCVTSTSTGSDTTKSDTITRTSLSTTTTSTTSSTTATTSTTTSTTSTHVFCDWSNTTSCPCGTVCAGCAPGDFDTGVCCVDRCGLEFVLGEFGLPLEGAAGLQLQLAAKLEAAARPGVTCNAREEAGSASNCTADLASGARCWADCPDDMLAVGAFSCLEGVTVGTSECFYLAGNVTVEEKNALTSAVRATLDGAAAAGGGNVSSAAVWRGVLAAAFGIDPLEISRLSVSDDAEGRRLGAAPPRGLVGLSSVLVAYEVVIMTAADADALLALAASPQDAVRAEFFSISGVDLEAVEVAREPRLFVTTVGSQDTTQTTVTSTTRTDTSLTETETTVTINYDAAVSGINALDQRVLFFVASLGACAVTIFFVLVVVMLCGMHADRAREKGEGPMVHELEAEAQSAEPESDPRQPPGFLTVTFERTGEQEVLEVFDDRPQRRYDARGEPDSDASESVVSDEDSDLGCSVPKLRVPSVCSHNSSGKSAAVARHNKIPEVWEETGGTGRPPSAQAMEYLADACMLSLQM